MPVPEPSDVRIVLDDALDAATCNALVAAAEQAGFSAGGQAGGPRVVDEHGVEAASSTAIVDEPRLALRLYHKLGRTLPLVREQMSLVGVGARMRVLRYEAGQRTELHCDPPLRRGEHETSVYTILVFLDDEFDGGATQFDGGETSIAAQRGRVVMFDQRDPHRGAPVALGSKHVLRGEVYYTTDERALDRR